MVTMSMHLLTRYYSAHELLFERAINAQVYLSIMSTFVHKLDATFGWQVVINESSISVFNEVSDKLPVMRRLATSKLTEEQLGIIVPILDYIREVCMIDTESEEAHRMNQNILYNQGVVGDLFDILNQKLDSATIVRDRKFQEFLTQFFQITNDFPIVKTFIFPLNLQFQLAQSCFCVSKMCMRSI